MFCTERQLITYTYYNRTFHRKKSAMKTEHLNEILQELRKPFHPAHVTWKPGSVNKEQTKALALAYADLRAYQNRLDEVCGIDWSVTYTPWGDRIVCHLTIQGITRSSTGEPDSQSERSEIAGTSAEAQAFKRACAMFGLGRYLYQLPTVWVEYDGSGRHFTDRAKARLEGIIVQHYRRTMEPKDEVAELFQNGLQNSSGDAEPEARSVALEPLSDALRTQFQQLGQELYAEQWAQVSQHNVERITGGGSNNYEDLTAEQIQKLVEGMKKLKRKRQTFTVVNTTVSHGVNGHAEAVPA